MLFTTKITSESGILISHLCFDGTLLYLTVADVLIDATVVVNSHSPNRRSNTFVVAQAHLIDRANSSPFSGNQSLKVI